MVCKYFIFIYFITSFLIKSMRLYGAYGSNLNLKQMQRRCPNSYPLNYFYLDKFALAFKGVADLEKKKEVSVLWQYMKLLNHVKKR